ncbi:MAG: PEP-CTERM sorting domain-containing protein [Chthonomonadales bacterium]
MKFPFAANATRIFALASLALALSLPSQAQTIALDFTAGGLGGAQDNSMLGWEFSLANQVTLTDLGIYDEGNDGLFNSHQIGLWTGGGTLVSSATIASGFSGSVVNSASGLGSFRFNNVSPVSLTPGSYVIGALWGIQDRDYIRTGSNNVPTPLNMAPGFSFTQLRYNVNSGFAFPASSFARNGHFGPDLRFTTVPEPGMVVSLLGAGSLGGFMLIRRRQSRRSVK